MSDRDTLDCDGIAPYLSAFADGELAESLRSEVATHLDGCDHCAAQLDRIRAVDRLLTKLPRTAPAAGVFERTMAAATRNAAATREALSGGGAADLRRRLREALAQDVRDASDTGDVGEAGGAHHARPRRRGRAPWIAAALPAVAALLLIALAATLFSHFPSFSQQGATSKSTPQAINPLQQTRSAMNALASRLAFTPAIPTYLPDGASAPSARIGPAEQVQENSRYLDVTWTFSSGSAQSLHLRELPAGLGFDGYTRGSSAATPLAWGLPQTAGWSALTATDCPTCLAVGETRSAVQLVLDAQPRGSASADSVAAWLRLVSLSLDTPYLPLNVNLSAPDSSLALRYQATVADGQGRVWDWAVSIVGAPGGKQSATATGNGVDVTEIANSGIGARLDNTTHAYEPLAPPLPSVQPPEQVTQPLFAPGPFISNGELWNLGPGQTKLPDGHTQNVYDLYWVNAAQPEHIYVDAATGQAIALVVTTPSATHPGGATGDQFYISTTACPPYTVTYSSIEYVPQTDLASSQFDTQQPAGWRQGTVAPAFTCQG